MAKKRPPKYCGECGKQLRSNWRSESEVCGYPKINGTHYSQCQKDRLVRLGKYGNIAKDTTGRKCAICDKLLENMTNANQNICKLPLEERKRLKAEGKPYRTECETKNQKLNGDNWKKVNRRTKKEIAEEREFFIGKEESDMLDYAPLKEPAVDNKKRRCVGILSQEGERGEHWFVSKGPYNRICDDCVEVTKMRELDHYKDDSEGYTVANAGSLSKRESE
jgi:hypothetical protein